jgi:uncharacterized protein YoaH (UPF0181 family)
VATTVAPDCGVVTSTGSSPSDAQAIVASDIRAARSTAQLVRCRFNTADLGNL